MKYVSIDIETTGLNPNSCDILEFAAVLDDLRNPLPLDKLPRYRSYILKETYRGEPYALGMHPQIFKKIAKVEKGANAYIDEDGAFFFGENDLMFSFQNFLTANGYEPNKEGKIAITVAGKNVANFDLPFLRANIQEWADIQVRHRTIDPAILYFDPTIDDQLPDSKTCMERAGIPGPVAHTALEDALVIVQLIRKKLVKTE